MIYLEQFRFITFEKEDRFLAKYYLLFVQFCTLVQFYNHKGKHNPTQTPFHAKKIITCIKKSSIQCMKDFCFLCVAILQKVKKVCHVCEFSVN